MAKGFATGVTEDLLDVMLGNALDQPLAIPTVFLALSTADPGIDGTGFVEPVGNGYGRVAVANDLTQWPAATAGVKKNGADIDFPEATDLWGTVTHFGIFVAASGGSPAAWGELDTSQSPDSPDQLQFAVGTLDVKISNQ